MKKIALIISCEHGVNTVPTDYQSYFLPFKTLLQTHRGMDFGALEVARQLRQFFDCDLIEAKASRLLIDCNRSLSNRHCYSEITKLFNQEQKKEIIENYYVPFRDDVKKKIKEHINQGKMVLHLSIHSFTPILNNILRETDLGILYDPKRTHERSLTRAWQKQLQIIQNVLRVRLNYPYKGVSDGFTTHLRKEFSVDSYLGLEVEMNQALFKKPVFELEVSQLLATTLQLALHSI